jgi:hypothetical protein
MVCGIEGGVEAEGISHLHAKPLSPVSDKREKKVVPVLMQAVSSRPAPSFSHTWCIGQKAMKFGQCLRLTANIHYAGD